MIARTLVLAAALVGVMNAPAAAQEDISSLVQQVTPSVVTLKSFGSSGRQISTGSGFALPDGRIVTNAHVVRGAANVEVFNAQGSLVGAVQHAEALSNSVDIAILPRVEGVPGLVLAAEEPAVGTRIAAVGAPIGLSNTVSDGIVSSIREIEGQRLIQITAPISAGSSGGPVVDGEGRVVGVSVASMRGGQNLNFAVPVANVRVLAASAPGQIAFSTARGPSADGGMRGGVDEGDARPLEDRVPVEGTLDFDDPLLADNSFFELWSFEAEQGDQVLVAMTSSDFDTYLSVGRMVDGRYIEIGANDDVGGFSRNSRLVLRIPRDGQYLVRANSLRGGATGTYTLRIEVTKDP
ncbi:MAG TPA: S1C family serine protease [Longimicrobium sp.]|nr:S1C family serine protease [Longimicrobium sp.]